MKKSSQSTPTTSWRELADWQKLQTTPPTDQELKKIFWQKGFFHTPAHNDQIARQHSVLLDKIFGFDLKTTEEALVKRGKTVLPQGSFEYWGPALHEGAQTWVGLDVQTLNTPYCVLARLLELLDLKPGMKVVDLGAAHGRLGILTHFHAREVHFLGLEYVPERVKEANRVAERWGCTRSRCEVQDLFARDFVLPEVDVYFIYDYGRHDHINSTLGQISLEAQKRPIRLVARGQATNKLIHDHHPWAVLDYEGVGEEHFNIYQTEKQEVV